MCPGNAYRDTVPVMRLHRYEHSQRVEMDRLFPGLPERLPVIELIEFRQWDVVRKLPRHTHDNVFHLDHFLDGQGTYMIDNRLNAIEKGVFYFVPPHVPHQLNVAETSNLAHLSIKFIYPGLDARFLPYFFAPEPEVARRVQATLRAAANLLFDDERKLLIATLMLMQALVDLHRAAQETGETTGEHIRIVAAKHFMEEHFTQHITLDDIAQAAGVGGPHLCRVFKKETSQTPFEFLRKIRLDCAKYWLSQTDEKLADIAVYTGFGSSQEMNRAFRKLEGMSPRPFRYLVTGNGGPSEEDE